MRLIANAPLTPIQTGAQFAIVILRVNVSTQVERIRSRSERTARASSVSVWRSR